jgi:hypothetical protein
MDCSSDKNPDTKLTSGLVHELSLAWSAWDLSLRCRNDFRANSFGLIALSTILDCLNALNKPSASTGIQKLGLRYLDDAISPYLC